MDFIYQVLDFFVHLEKHLAIFIKHYGIWTYPFLFLIIFCETGLVITPFLPGDSLLFVAGSLATLEGLNVHLLVILLIIAAIMGDSVNYWIGNKLGSKAFQKENARFFKKKYLDMTKAFYERHGGKTIIIARFIPIIRTFAPFVAGIGKMHYPRFISYNIVGAILWVTLLTYAGYFFGSLPLVKNNLAMVIMGIIILSISPGIIAYFRNRWQKQGIE